MPTDNYVKNISLNNKWQISYVLNYRSTDLKNIFRIKWNLEFLKKKWFIKSYKIWNIERWWWKKLCWKAWCYFETIVSFEPNININLRNFLYNKYKFYRKIYNIFDIKRKIEKKRNLLEANKKQNNLNKKKDEIKEKENSNKSNKSNKNNDK